ncbi:Leucine-rich repeat domain containing protein [Parasponia andersonii]|uniref:Leucine-rich repeat domain containing protein n=1 Tax=Parasponia andersonii TaxID=3476 RepID=A0A2P5BSD1_PARAD|nr:Leucine-rich repeat domain containing protein [Parasponia andersonii]
MGKLLRTDGLFLVFLTFLEIVQLCFCMNSTLGCIEGERQSLLKLKQSFQDNSSRLSSWTGKDCCKWEGVSCGETGHVVKLDLSTSNGSLITDKSGYSYKSYDFYNSSKQVSAPEVDPCLLEFKHLVYLDLSGNDFQGSRIPKFLGSLKHLRYLDLSNAGFSGMIPHQLGNLTSLRYLDLSFQGQVLSSSGGLYADNFQWVSRLSSLQHLDISYANLEEALDVMQVLNTLPSLLHINLNSCGIRHRHFPRGSFNTTFLARINFLSLADNMLSGPIPSALQNMTALRELDLSANSFNSTVPLGLVNSKNLVRLSLSGSSFNYIEGGLLSILNKVCSLKSLDLSFNYFQGDGVLGSNYRNSSRCLAYDLAFLDLRDNEIGGRIPYWFGQLKGLKYLYIDSNSFSGPIPSSLKLLLMLREFDLSNNQLNGTIPQSLGKLTSLEELNLSGNQLNGIIPQSLGRVSTLKELDISNNQLGGFIPESLGQLVNLEWLYISNNL